jgi:hypothetical protein
MAAWRIALSLSLAIALGYGIASTLLRGSRLLRLLIGLPIGMGFTSIALFLSLRRTGLSARYALVEGLLLIVLILAMHLYRRQRIAQPAPEPLRQGPHRHGLQTLALAATSVLLLACIVRFGVQSVQFPRGLGDGMEFWNLKARFLAGGGEYWKRVFVLEWWTHPDYPLLVSASVARLWVAGGSQLPIAPVALAGLFTFGTIGLLTSAIAHLRGSVLAGLLAGIVLLGRPGLVTLGAMQYPDVSLGMILLAALVACAMQDQGKTTSPPAGALLIGLLAGCAAWTKNEGILFAGALLLVRGLRRPREVAWMLLGMSPFVVATAIVKLHSGGSNDLLAGGPVERMVDLSRYPQITMLIGKELLRFAPALGLLAVYAWLMGFDRAAPRTTVRTILPILTILLLAYLCAYIVTPHDLNWHIRTSFERLALQLWPAGVFGVFLAVRSPTGLQE